MVRFSLGGPRAQNFNGTRNPFYKIAVRDSRKKGFEDLFGTMVQHPEAKFLVYLSITWIYVFGASETLDCKQSTPTWPKTHRRTHNGLGHNYCHLHYIHKQNLLYLYTLSVGSIHCCNSWHCAWMPHHANGPRYTTSHSTLLERPRSSSWLPALSSRQ